MSWHTSVWSSSIASVANTQLNAVQDGIYRVGPSNGIVVPKKSMLIWAALMAATVRRGFFSTPTILQTNPLYVRPTMLSAQPISNPNFAYWQTHAFTVPAMEELLVFATGASAGEQTTMVAGLAESIDPIPNGNIVTVYLTSSTAAVALTWTQVATVLVNALPVGTYAMVGSQVSSATAIAHRWTFPNQFVRPGFLSAVLETNQPSYLQLDRSLGMMGQFPNYNLPLLEVFCTSTDASHQIFVDLVKVSNFVS